MGQFGIFTVLRNKKAKKCTMEIKLDSRMIFQENTSTQMVVVTILRGTAEEDAK